MLYAPTIFPQILTLLRASLGEPTPAWYDRILAVQGLVGIEFGQDPASLHLGRFETVFLECLERNGRTDLAFEMALRMTPAHFGLLASTARNCATLGQLVRVHARYFRLTSSAFGSTYQEDETGLEWVRRPAAFMAPTMLSAMLEFYAVGACRYLSHFFPGALPRFDITIGMEAPAHVGRYQLLHPVQFHFGLTRLPEMRYHFRKALIDLPLTPHIDLPLSTPGELNSLIYTLQPGGDTAQWIRLMLSHCQDCQPTRAELADLLNVSSRTLTRALSRAGLSLRQIGKEVRHRRACQLLAETDEPILHIALRLGYSDATNFTHAFRRECGISPRCFRQQAQARVNKQE